MSSRKAIRILIADDHPVTREGLAAIINAQEDMAVVAEASSGEEAIERFRTHRPDITLLDLRLSGMDGIAATAAILKDFRSARIIILTSFSGDEFILELFRLLGSLVDSIL